MQFWKWLLAILGFVGFPLLLTHLLKGKHITKTSFSTLLPLCLALTLILVQIDNIDVVELLGAKMTLRKVENIKNEIYAKSDAVQKLAEEVALSSVDVISIGNRSGTTDWVGLGVTNMVTSRDRALTILKAAGSGEAKLAEVKARYNSEIRHRMARDVYYVLGFKNPTGISPTLAVTNLQTSYGRKQFEVE